MKTCQKRQVEQYLHAVGQVLTSMGACDPRHDTFGKTDFRISRQLRSYTRADPAPQRVKPLPIAVLHNIFAHNVSGTEKEKCIADIIWIGFYLLMQPGEHCDAGANSDSTPFHLCDVTFWRQGAKEPSLTQRTTPSTSLPRQITSPSHSPRKKMESKEKSLVRGAVDTQRGVWFAACYTVWRTFDADAPPGKFPL